ncbi:hypothetical protein A2961_03370 [Candidatus Woesebacteria bacterium RIFCSPLOWO2_01_FULL_39_21]|uniref:Uncharacterized protein n=1 Tax=Candidatus Woesebacteria bacterium RIFCSPLOWO2_01_FULL_39_21 TaxID=1802519 RepID=A0A1F8BFP2_9BACT|nr:MAG: hypothetical protein A2961_03370 [Candidatus Woesebacteria bacterium RIFCSPLOWO2_01_FULL_39_21]
MPRDIFVEGYTDGVLAIEGNRTGLVEAIREGMVKFEEQQDGRVDFSKFPVAGTTIEVRPEDLLPTGEVSGVLSSKGILRDLVLGRTTIYPFDPRSLGDNSYDLKIAEDYYVIKPQFKWVLPFPGTMRMLLLDRFFGKHSHVFNPWSKVDSERYWEKPRRARTPEQLKRDLKVKDLNGFRNGDLILAAYPGTMLLGSTQEFVGTGGNVGIVSARSSIGRSHWTVCEDAFLINQRYKNRIALELRSKFSPEYEDHWNILIVGERVAQIAFLSSEEALGSELQRQTKYSQSGKPLDEIIRDWTPQEMLPKLYKDREGR